MENYSAEVLTFSEKDGIHTVRYFIDGEQEAIDLREHQWFRSVDGEKQGVMNDLCRRIDTLQRTREEHALEAGAAVVAVEAAVGAPSASPAE
eukprot:3558030-Prymnesium_polylepis.1